MTNDRRPLVGFLATASTTDERAWSGTVRHMALAVERHLGPVESLGPLPSWPGHLGAVASRLLQYTTGRRLLGQHTLLGSRVLARSARRRLVEVAPDLVMAPAASVSLASFETELPVVYLSDATIRQLLGYYPAYSDVAPRSARTADQLEAAAIDRADLLVYPTSWAADSAVRDYGADPARVLVVPFGANLSVDTTDDRGGTDEDHDGDAVLRLLLVGVDWHTKGVDAAVEAVTLLRDQGVTAELAVLGCEAPGPVPPWVDVVGFVDKHSPAGLAAFRRHFERSHLLLLPSRAEAYGIVLAEAAAFGLPVVARATGGVPEVLPADAARLFAEDGGPAELAAAITEVWQDRDELRRMGRRSREHFESTLNWDAWGAVVADEVRRLLAVDAPER